MTAKKSLHLNWKIIQIIKSKKKAKGKKTGRGRGPIRKPLKVGNTVEPSYSELPEIVFKFQDFFIRLF